MDSSTRSDDALAALGDVLAAALEPVVRRALAAALPPPDPPAEPTWRERLWTCPEQTRLGVREAAEALGRPVSWVYRRTSPKALAAGGHAPLPARRLDGELYFSAADLREWIAQHEERPAAVTLWRAS